MHDTNSDHDRVSLRDVDFGDTLHVVVTWQSRPDDSITGTVDQIREFRGEPEIKLDCGREGRLVIYGDHTPPAVEATPYETAGRLARLERIEEPDPTLATVDAPEVERDTDRVTDPVRPEGGEN